VARHRIAGLEDNLDVPGLDADISARVHPNGGKDFRVSKAFGMDLANPDHQQFLREIGANLEAGHAPAEAITKAHGAHLARVGAANAIPWGRVAAIGIPAAGVLGAGAAYLLYHRAQKAKAEEEQRQLATLRARI
jgi:hypothetical protein